MTECDQKGTLRGEVKKNVSKNAINNQQERRDRRQLTGKQVGFVQHYTDPECVGFQNATKSAELAGYKGEPGSTQLRVQGHHNLTKPNIRAETERALNEAGATIEKVALRLAEGLAAAKIHVFCHDGRIYYSVPLVDFRQRREYAEIICKLLGVFPTPNEQERMNLLQIQQTFNLVPPVDPVPEVIEIEGTVEE